MSELRLVVGLGNPGDQYARTRHNVGERWLRSLAARFGVSLNPERKFKGELGRGDILGHDVRLLFPTTFMNVSGESVGAVAAFYKIEPQEVLVAYDEVAFDPGTTKLKVGGGDNGHNGIRSVVAGLGNAAGFARLRIGVGHPGDPSTMTSYLTRVAMPEPERAVVEASVDMDDVLLGHVLDCDWQKAMTLLHSKPGKADATDVEGEDTGGAR